MKIIFKHDVDYNKLDIENKFYVAVSGSRNVTDYEIISEFIKMNLMFLKDELELEDSDIAIVSGGAKGVDQLAERFAEKEGYDLIVIKPDWEKYGKKAGILRNSNIIKLANVLIAFPSKDSVGTIDAIKKAEKRGILVKTLEFD